MLNFKVLGFGYDFLVRVPATNLVDAPEVLGIDYLFVSLESAPHQYAGLSWRLLSCFPTP
jgi:hypothetical protein